MAREWTQAQKAAIEAENADILVAAAAGSGKTAVLVERIIRKITDQTRPVDLDRLLVVTFTKAAAEEMRQRIDQALSQRMEEEPDNELLTRQYVLISRASITTIHAFCHQVLRSNFHLLGLDPSFRIADPTENELIRFSALEEVIEEMYEDPVFAESFLKLTESYLNIKNTEKFYGLINRIFNFSMSLPRPETWLNEAAERFLDFQTEGFDKSPYAEILLETGRQNVQAVLKKYDTMLAMAEKDDGGEVLTMFLAEEKLQFVRLLSLTTYDAFYHALQEVSFSTIPSAPKKSQPIYREAIRKLRDEVKAKDMKHLREDCFPSSLSEQKDVLDKLAPLMSCLSQVVSHLRKRFDEKKAAKNILNYNDLEHGCYQLLVDENGQRTELADVILNQFDEILIDEYQDTSALQDAIFEAIKKPGGLFLVGDMKQSIYRFRNTDPRLFQAKKERYQDEERAKERKIILSQNFRSRAGVLDCINYIFTNVMSRQVGDIAYNEEEMLYPGLFYPDMKNPLPQGAELCLVEMKNQTELSEDYEAIELEAHMAAQKIQELMTGNYQVLGKEGERNLCYRDICILMRSTKSTAEVYAKVLSEYGIPCYSDVGSSFLQSEEITVMLSLLKIIDNPHQDIPLLSVLRSQLYAFSPDELAEIRLADRKSDFFDALKHRSESDDALGEKLKDFLENLLLYREKSRQLSMAELIWYLYMQTGFYEAQATLKGGSLRRLNLRLLYVRASAFESTGLKGLYSFIHFIDECQSAGGDYDAARSIGEEQDVVRIMSIHKSKGLEFPVVMLGNIGRKIYNPDIQETIIVHSELGYGPQYIDTDFGIVYPNVARSAVKAAVKRDNLSEEMRILYVALTRAREKLILLGSGKDLEKEMESLALNDIGHEVAMKAETYLDWIFMALSANTEDRVLENIQKRGQILVEEGVPQFYLDLKEADDVVADVSDVINEEVAVSEEQTDFSKLLWDISYAFEAETHLPAKVTVSEVKRRAVEEEHDSVYLYPRPAFLAKRSGKLSTAQVGTATHSVLEDLDYGRSETEASISEQIKEMVLKGSLSQEEADAVSVRKIFTFMTSPIGRRLQKAKKVLREVSFGINVSAEELLKKKGQLMLQGIIDCVLFEEEGISILDYKTDHGPSPEEIKERYRIQLDCYQKAAETLYGQQVVHRYLYLFHYDLLLEL